MRTAALAVAILTLGATLGSAGGLATRSPSQRRLADQRMARQSGNPTHIQLNRPRDGYGGTNFMRAETGYRRTPTGTVRRMAPTPQNGIVQRTAGAFLGYDARDGLTLGAGRIVGGQYGTARDQAIATQRGRQVAGWSQRIGSAVGRFLRP